MTAQTQLALLFGPARETKQPAGETKGPILETIAAQSKTIATVATAVGKPGEAATGGPKVRPGQPEYYSELPF